MNFKPGSNMAKLKKTCRESGSLWAVSQVMQKSGLPIFRLWPKKNYSQETLSKQVAAILGLWGMPESHVNTAVKHIIYSDLHGIESHGCAMLRHYYRQLKNGALSMNPKVEIIRQSDTTALIDGGGGLGHIPADTAMKLAIDKCCKSGVGVVTVRNSGHFGAAGSYAAMASESDLVGVAMTNILQPALVPTYGLSPMLGTNPIAFSAPASRNRPFLLDMATSIVPVGKIVMALRKGHYIPYGWAANKRGRMIKNPGIAISNRRLTPLGGTPEMGSYKGYGLAAMVEILTSLLNDATDKKPEVGHFFMALNPEHFVDTNNFKNKMDNLIDGLRSSDAKNKKNPVQVAGDPEYRAAAERLKNGIPLTRSVIEDIRSVCVETGAPFFL